MNVLVVAREALFSIGANKLRAGLTLLGIVIGVAAVISLMAIGNGVQQTIVSRIASLGTDVLYVRPSAGGEGAATGARGAASTLTIEDAYALVDPVYAPDVSAVAPELRTSGRVVAGRENTGTQVVGVTPEYQVVRNFAVDSGLFVTWFHVRDRAEVAVLGSEVAEELFGNRGPVGRPVRINGRRFTVVGVLESKGGSGLGNQDNQVLVPVSTAYYRLSSARTPGGQIAVRTINVQVDSSEAIDRASEQVSTILRLRHRITEQEDFSVSSPQEVIETVQATTQSMVFFLGAIAGISLLVGGIGVMNIMLVSVTERTREIGIRKAVGAKRRDILFQFVAEATLLTLAGGGVGVLIGVSLAEGLSAFYLSRAGIQAAFAPDIALLALAVSAGIGLFFGIYPAARAARLHPIEALRYE